MSSKEAKWYIIKCPSGVEEKFVTTFKEYLEKAKKIELLQDIFIPNNTTPKSTNRRSIMANYVFVKLIYEESLKEIMRRIKFASFMLDTNLNIAQVDEDTILNLKEKDLIERKKQDSILQVGETIIVKEAPFMDFEGTVEKVKEEEKTVNISINILGNPIFIELPFTSIKRINNE